MAVEYRAVPLLETKASETSTGGFSGYGAVFNNVDAQGDVIQPGAFKGSLKDWQQRGKFPPMLLQHGGVGGFGAPAPDDLLPVGQWLDMTENRQGLKVEGQLFALGTERGQYIYEGLKAGVLDGLSIGFMAREFTHGTRPGEPDRLLTAVDLWEVSIVTFPANPKARIGAVKALTVETLRPLEDYLCEDLRDVGFSRNDCKRIISKIRTYLQRDAEEPEREPRDAAAAGVLADRLESLQLQSLLTHITAGGPADGQPARHHRQDRLGV